MSKDKKQVTRKKSHIIDISIKDLSTPIDYTKIYFTEVEPYYSDEKPSKNKGIQNHYSLEGLMERLNSLPKGLEKNQAPAILKGTYKGGTKGVYCCEASPFLFFDIDVKKQENKPLKDNYKNSTVFEFLKDISIIVFRSHSGQGMAGVLYVPILQDYLNNERETHKKIGDKLCLKLSEYINSALGVCVEFDNAQNKFRQIRYLAHQESIRYINLSPKQFDVSLSIIEKKTSTGIPIYKTNYSATGSIEYQYDQNTSIKDELTNCNFEYVGGERYKHPSTTSQSSGEQKNNLFFNYSSSFSSKKVFSPFTLHLECNDITKDEFIDELQEKGYKNKDVTDEKINSSLVVINNINASSKDIFKVCYDLQYLPEEDKLSFIERVNLKKKKIVQNYIKSTNLTIEYHKELCIDERMSEVLEEILDLSDSSKKLCVYSETGSGKTTAILKDFTKHRPNQRCLLLVPLKSIVNQCSEEYPEYAYLTGNSNLGDFDKAKRAQLVVATYEQGNKYFNENFDYIVIDEFHVTVSANSFKKETVSELTTNIMRTSSVVIGLTGTPINILRETSFKFLKIKIKNLREVQVVERNDNRDGIKILKQHQSNVLGKVMYRYNNIDVLKDFRKELIQNYDYREEEILLLYAEAATPNNADYNYLIKNKKFKNSVKIVLTTSFIEEGLSIKQEGFSDVVFIEDQNYHLRAEPLKQFFARFRNHDTNRINYLYRKRKKNQTTYYFDEIEKFNKKKNYFKENKTENMSLSFYNSLIRDMDYYTINKSVDEFFIAYKISDAFYKSLNNLQFAYFLKHNYNLSLNLDFEYSKSHIEIKYHEEEKRKRKEMLYDLWVNHVEVIKSFCHEWSKDKSLKKDKDRFIYTDEQANLIEENIKDTEARLKLYYRAELLNIEPLSLIISKKGLKNLTAVKNELRLQETLCMLERTGNKTDEMQKKKLVTFLRSIYSKTEFKIYEAKRLFKEHVTCEPLTNQNLEKLIKLYAKVTYDKRKKRYTVKYCKLCFQKKKWVKSTVTIPLYKEKLLPIS